MMNVLAAFERHNSLSGFATTVSTKTFVVQFINLVIIILLVSSDGVFGIKTLKKSDLENISPLFKTFALFSGNFGDLDNDWCKYIYF